MQQAAGTPAFGTKAGAFCIMCIERDEFIVK
jgi:hypothetical protein